MQITENWKDIDFKKVIEVYNSTQWSSYTKNEKNLLQAFQNSSLVLLALEGNNVIGVLRSISDSISIHYLQDILVNPIHQRKGVGRALFNRCLEIYKDVRTHILLTDDEEMQKAFYESLGFKNTKELKENILNSFVKMKDVSLK